MKKINTIFIKTYGCSFNQFDSELIKNLLTKANYKIVQDLTSADCIIINSCSVKNSAEAKLFNDINRISKLNKKIIICGCVPQAEKSYLKTKFKNLSVFGTNDINSVIKIVKDLENNIITHKLSNIWPICRSNLNRIELKKKLLLKEQTSKKITYILPINEGCLGNCSFCKTKFARGNLKSYPINEIKSLFQQYLKLGAKEIYLTSQDTACYGRDINTNLVELLKELIKIDGDYKIRIGMGNPNFFKDIITNLLNLIKKTDKIYKFLHIPVQSGSNKILKLMNRQYTIKEYKTIIQICREIIPQITIANDLIVGFPTENQNDFQQTLDILKIGGTDVLNFSRFWLRPNTKIKKLVNKNDFIEGAKSKERAIDIKKKFELLALEQNSKWIGWQGKAIITEKGKKGTNSLICRNEYYKPIVLIFNTPKELNQFQIGDKIKLKINSVTWFDFRGQIIKTKNK